MRNKRTRVALHTIMGQTSFRWCHRPGPPAPPWLRHWSL